ncbi:ABC transporter permease [Ramlibacter tataouinensis]|uniref:ABC transporter permease n=1 Tax=Ramlibacter tataouinensis TaxID=94132 RepID=UPI0022F3DC8B|nr:ABC transporter permease [Ramlibacter tataouinensis]WBY02769.1 ABC transporter permease [Ramlibacter tataouinensis]
MIEISLSCSGHKKSRANLLRHRAAALRQAMVTNKAASLGAAVLIIILLAVICAPLLTSHDPEQQNLAVALQSPSAAHWFGTDELGRDIFSRILYGGRITLLIGASATAIALLIGVSMGLLSGYFGGWFDLVIQRITDTLLAMAGGGLLAIALVATLGVELRNVIIASAAAVVPQFVRLSRGLALSLKSEMYIEAAIASGVSHLAIIRTHILRNCVSAVVVFAMLNIGVVVLIAAGLGFLGLGVQDPMPEWGTMLGAARATFISYPHTVTIPGLFILLTIFACNLVGDGLRDFLDPRLRGIA